MYVCTQNVNIHKNRNSLTDVSIEKKKKKKEKKRKKNIELIESVRTNMDCNYKLSFELYYTYSRFSFIYIIYLTIVFTCIL